MSIEPQTAIFPATLSEALDRFLLHVQSSNKSQNTIRVYKFDISHFIQWIKEQYRIQNVSDLTSDHIRLYMVMLEEEHNDGGVHGYFRCIRVFLNWYWDEYEIDRRNPIDKVKRKPPPPNPLPGVSIDHIRRMISACNTDLAARDRAILWTLLDTGARASEFTALNIADVEFSTGAVRINHGKGNKARTVYIGAKCQRAVRRYLKTRSEANPHQPLFLNDENDRLKFSGLRQIVRRRAESANIEVPGLHDFRRAFGLELWRNGTDIKTISKLMGHKDVRTTERYLRLDDQDVAERYRRASPVDNIEW